MGVFIKSSVRLLITGVLVVSAVSLFSCVEKKMTLTEAKQVSVAMRQNSFTPPPRSIEDILWVLNQPGTFDKNITAATIAKADALPPETHDPKQLSAFYQARGNAANGLGRAEQELQDKRTALVYARKIPDISPKKMSSLLRTLGVAEIKLGNFKTGQDLCREGLGLFPTPSHYYVLAATLFKMGDFDQATQMIQEGISLCNRAAQKSSGKKKLRVQADREHLNALYFSALGQHKKAEPHWQKYHQILESVKDKRPSTYLMSFLHLGKNLKSQGRLLEAELQVRQGLRGAIAHAGKNSTITGDMAGFFGEVLLKQGRIDDARKMTLASIDAYEKAGVADGSTSLAKVRTLLGEVNFAKEDFLGAAKQFETVKKDMNSNLYIYNTRVVQNHNIILTNLLTGNIREAMGSVAFFFENLSSETDCGILYGFSFFHEKGRPRRAIKYQLFSDDL